VDAQNEYNLHGFYGEAGYGITPEWHLLGRFDRIVQQPGQSAPFTGVEQFDRSSITVGILRYLFHENREIARAYLNYNAGESSPGNFGNHAVVLVLQLRFIPV